MLGKTADAEDFTQEVLRQVVRKLNTLHGTSCLTHLAAPRNGRRHLGTPARIGANHPIPQCRSHYEQGSKETLP
jgi:hypothetical protein